MAMPLYVYTATRMKVYIHAAVPSRKRLRTCITSHGKQAPVDLMHDLIVLSSARLTGATLKPLQKSVDPKQKSEHALRPEDGSDNDQPQGGTSNSRPTSPM